MIKTEQMLYRYGDLKKRISECRLEISAQYEERDSFLKGQLTPPSMNNIKVQGGSLSDPVYRSVQVMMDIYDERIIRLQEQMRELYNEYDTIKYVIDEAGLTERERMYIELRYVDRLSFDRISSEMGYTERAVFCVRNIVIQKLQFFFS